MAVQYNRLWKLLIDKKMKKSALTELAAVSYTHLDVYKRQIIRTLSVPVAQLDRVPDSDSGGCRFDPCRVRHFYFIRRTA